MNYLTPMEFLEVNAGKIGRNLLYDEIKAGRIPHIRVGRRILIPEDAWDQMLGTGVAEPPAEASIYLNSRSFDAAC
jgi:excisionase family DNA binding protein